jgi:hypothetical protein
MSVQYFIVDPPRPASKAETTVKKFKKLYVRQRKRVQRLRQALNMKKKKDVKN